MSYQKEVHACSLDDKTMDKMVEILNKAKGLGADFVRFEIDRNPVNGYSFIRFYRTVSDAEQRQEKIAQLEAQLKELKG
jgi:hypothetical protein